MDVPHDQPPLWLRVVGFLAGELGIILWSVDAAAKTGGYRVFSIVMIVVIQLLALGALGEALRKRHRDSRVDLS